MGQDQVNSFSELQAVTGKWREYNFPSQNAYHQFLGIAEEVGELAHAFLKQEQGIRGDEELRALELDAVGDILIFLCGYCTYRDISLFECANAAWESIKDRDWITYPRTGRPTEGAGE